MCCNTSLTSVHLNKLSAITGDWGRWDDTYQFVRDLNHSYIENNMITITFTELRLDHIVYLDSSSRIIYAAGYDLSSRKRIAASDPVHQKLADTLRNIRPNASHLKGVSGIVIVDNTPTLVAAYPILSSKGTGPSRGTLVMARHLDSAEIRYLAETARMSVAIERMDDPGLLPDFRNARYNLRNQKTFVRFVDASRSVGYALLNDINGKPAAILRVDTWSPMLIERKTSVRLLLISMLAIGIVFAVVSTLTMHKVVMARLSRISTDIAAIGRTGNLLVRLTETGRDELSDIAVTVNWMLESLGIARDKLESRVDERTKELALARESLEIAYKREHHIAEVLQRSLVESIDIVQSNYEIVARYQPALKEAEVGGDFYDVFTVCENRVAVVIGDVSGKGLAAAIFTAMAKYMLRAYAHENPQPAQVLQKLNEALCDYTPEDMFITVFLGILDPAASTFTYANAGHDYPLLFRAVDGLVTQLHSTGLVIGNIKGVIYGIKTLDLASGDTLMLYTDGITDARNGGPPLGIDYVSQVFQANARAGGQCVVDAIFNAACEAVCGNWPDDAAVMIIKAGLDRS